MKLVMNGVCRSRTLLAFIALSHVLDGRGTVKSFTPPPPVSVSIPSLTRKLEKSSLKSFAYQGAGAGADDAYAQQYAHFQSMNQVQGQQQPPPPPPDFINPQHEEVYAQQFSRPAQYHHPKVNRQDRDDRFSSYSQKYRTGGFPTRPSSQDYSTQYSKVRRQERETLNQPMQDNSIYSQVRRQDRSHRGFYSNPDPSSYAQVRRQDRSHRGFYSTPDPSSYAQVRRHERENMSYNGRGGGVGQNTSYSKVQREQKRRSAFSNHPHQQFSYQQQQGGMPPPPPPPPGGMGHGPYSPRGPVAQPNYPPHQYQQQQQQHQQPPPPYQPYPNQQSYQGNAAHYSQQWHNRPYSEQYAQQRNARNESFQQQPFGNRPNGSPNVQW